MAKGTEYSNPWWGLNYATSAGGTGGIFYAMASAGNASTLNTASNATLWPVLEPPEIDDEFRYYLESIKKLASDLGLY